jgi:hypothetical protein
VTRITIPGTVEERILELQVGASRMFKCTSLTLCQHAKSMAVAVDVLGFLALALVQTERICLLSTDYRAACASGCVGI